MPEADKVQVTSQPAPAAPEPEEVKAPPVAADAETPEPEATEEPVEAAAEDGEAKPEGEAAPEGDKSKKDTRSPTQKRIDALQAEKTKLARKAREAEARAAELEAKASKEETKPLLPELDQAAIDRRVREEAARIVAQDKAKSQYETCISAGNQEYGKDVFDAACDVLVQGYGDIINKNPDFLNGVTAMPGGHKVLKYLGDNPEKAAEILGKTGMSLAIELASLNTKLSTPAEKKKVSNAPTPITPISGNGGTGEIDLAKPDISQEDWFEARAKQRAARMNGQRA